MRRGRGFFNFQINQKSRNADQVRLAFFKKWFSELDWRWRRVVIGCDVLIDNCCDPDKDVLALRPKFQPGDTAI